MKNNPFALDAVLPPVTDNVTLPPVTDNVTLPPVTDDVTLPPVTEFELFANDYGWIICIAALLVIAATIGIVFFIKKNKENKK